MLLGCSLNYHLWYFALCLLGEHWVENALRLHTAEWFSGNELWSSWFTHDYVELKWIKRYFWKAHPPKKKNKNASLFYRLINFLVKFSCFCLKDNVEFEMFKTNLHEKSTGISFYFLKQHPCRFKKNLFIWFCVSEAVCISCPHLRSVSAQSIVKGPFSSEGSSGEYTSGKMACSGLEYFFCNTLLLNFVLFKNFYDEWMTRLIQRDNACSFSSVMKSKVDIVDRLYMYMLDISHHSKSFWRVSYFIIVSNLRSDSPLLWVP